LFECYVKLKTIRAYNVIIVSQSFGFIEKVNSFSIV